jgi:D-alanyl-D-alanine carboxypeptidase/D-alanyl-D-alanine-endopeptidase (penicillin-binding protein 4)
MNNPPLVLGRVLADRIEQAGGKIEGEIKLLSADQAPLTGAQPLIKTATPLSLVMNRADKRSVNMIAEGMFLRAGDGTFQGSAELETQTLRQTYGLDAGSFTVSDGSGFSRNNKVSPRAMVKLLTAVLKRRDNRVLIDSLPVSGVDGTLSKRMTDAPYRARVLGKTGYIAGVSALSGYVLDSEGRPAVAYSVLVNKCADLARAKRTEEMVCRAIVDMLDGKKEDK